MWIKLDDGGYAKAKRNFGCLFYIKFIIYERDITFVVGGDPRMQLTFRLAAPKPENGEWVHIAGTQDGIFARFYINGELMKQSIGEVVTNGHLLPFGQVKSPWRFGLTYPWGKSGRYRGYVDDVRLYSKALSPEELKKLYEESRELVY
jgi:hypothetical protein